jgi:hypothetical protein
MWPVRWGGFSSNGGVLTDRIAVILGLVLIGLALLDVLANGGGVLLFLARKFAVFLDAVMFWR